MNLQAQWSYFKSSLWRVLGGGGVGVCGGWKAEMVFYFTSSGDLSVISTAPKEIIGKAAMLLVVFWNMILGGRS